MGWFENELNYSRGRYDDDDGDIYEVEPVKGGSLTGRLWDYMGPSNWGWSSPTKANPEAQARDTIQKEVAGTVNLLNNSTDGNERSLKLGFASMDGEQANDITSDKVIMPADIVAQTGSEEAAIDVMSGMALIASTMKTTVDFHACAAAIASKDKGGHYLWTALEQAVARRAVSDKWPGFDSYFDSHRDHCTTVEGPDIAAMQDKDKSDGVKGGVRIQTALVAAAYNTLNPRDAKLMDDERMRKVMNLIADLALEGEAPDRFSKSCNIAEFIKRVFEKDEEEEEGSPDPDTEGDKGEGGEGEDNKGDDKDGEGEGEGEDDKGDEGGDKDDGDPYKELPAQADETLFGKVMKGTSENSPPKTLEELMLPRIDDHDQGGPLKVIVRGFRSTKGKEKAYNRTVANLKGEIKAVVNSLLFMNNHPESHIHGMRNGTLDPGSLHKLAITDMDEPRVFEQIEDITGKKIAVSLLIDRSGSMGVDRMKAACQVATILVEALGKIDGIELNVHTHTTSIGDGYLKRIEETGHDGTPDLDLVIHDIVAEGEDRRQVLVDLDSGYQNLDGYAIKHIGDRMAKDYPDYDEKIIFVISDGEPHSSRYSGCGAMRHVGDTAEFCRAVHKVKVFGIGVDNAFDDADGEMMYGEGNFIILSDVKSSIKVMTSFLRNVAVKQ